VLALTLPLFQTYACSATRNASVTARVAFPHQGHELRTSPHPNPPRAHCRILCVIHRFLQHLSKALEQVQGEEEGGAK